MQTAFTSGQLAKFIVTLEKQGVTYDHFQDFLESGVAGDIFDPAATLKDRVAICKAIGVDPEKRGLLFFEIDYPINLQSLFEATGCYCPQDKVNIAFSEVPQERQPEQPTTRRFEAKLFRFTGVSRRNIRRAMLRAGWTPAGHEHLLALLAKYPMGAKPIDPISLQKLIALARPATIAFTLAGMGGCSRALKEFIGAEGQYGPSDPWLYLGVRQLD